MSHTNKFSGRSFNQVLSQGARLDSVELVPADNHVFDINYPPLVILNPAGAVDVLMPAATGNKGRWFLISNISASTITLKTSGDAAFTTAISLVAGKTQLVFCTGSATAALGWRSIISA